MKGWSEPPPAREDMVLNILGTRVMLPTEPDYDINMLPHFVKEACGTRGFRGCVRPAPFHPLCFIILLPHAVARAKQNHGRRQAACLLVVFLCGRMYCRLGEVNRGWCQRSGRTATDFSVGARGPFFVLFFGGGRGGEGGRGSWKRRRNANLTPSELIDTYNV